MNSRTTWWLVGIAVVMFAFIFLLESRGPASLPRRGQRPPLLANFEPNHVRNIEIEWTDRTNQSIRAERAGIAWQLAAPTYPAHPGAIEQFLRTLTTLQQLAAISPNDIAAQTNRLAAFGLDPPRAVITLQADTNRLTLHVGMKTLVGDQVYVQIAGQSGVHVTAGELFKALPANAFAWRHLGLVHAQSDIDNLAVTNAGRGFQIQLDVTNRLWKLVWSTSTFARVRADIPRINQLIQQIGQTQINRFVTDDPREDLDRYGLQNPEIELALTHGTNEVLHVQFGKSPTNDATQVYAKRRSSPTVFLVPKEGLLPLLTHPHAYYRDHKFISLNSARSINRFEGGAEKEGLFTVERRGTNSWQIMAPFEARADTELVNGFFRDLDRVQIIDFVADLAESNSLAVHGLNAPARLYRLLSTIQSAAGLTNVPLVQLDFSAPGTNLLDRVLARRSDEPSSVYAVPYGEVTQLPAAAFRLRDRRLWSFEETNVISVAITIGGQTNVLARGPVQGRWSTDPILSEQRAEAIHRLGRVRVVSWTGRGEDQVKSFPMNCRVEVLAQAAGQRKTFVLQFGGLALGGTGLYAISVLEEGKPVLFVFPTDEYSYLLKHLGLGAGETITQ